VDTLGGVVTALHLQPFLAREINGGLSGGEIKRSELLQLLITQPKFAMLDEPDSGIDLESMALIGQTINLLLATNVTSPGVCRAGLIITHTGHILGHVAVDQAHVMLDGQIMGAGDPQFVIDQIRQCGFEGCVQALCR
jgi:Fe-S cluster assembly ATP-binding protein